jgi:preprotein translocase subunit SecD
MIVHLKNRLRSIFSLKNLKRIVNFLMLKHVLMSKWKILLITSLTVLGTLICLPSLIPLKAVEVVTDKKLNLGLDLRGGASLLLEIDRQAFYLDNLNNKALQIKSEARSKKLKLGRIRQVENGFNIKIDENTDQKALKKLIYNVLSHEVYLTVTDSTMQVRLSDADNAAISADLANQTLEIIRRRVDEAGTKEIDLSRQGDSHILLQVPGMSDPSEIKRLIGKTAKLSLHIVESTEYKAGDSLSPGTKALPLQESPNVKFVVSSRPALTGDALVNAQATTSQFGQPVVNFTFNNFGARVFGDVTKDNSGKLLAIVLDNKIISTPRINEPILGGQGIIQGNFTIASANELALLLRAGSLPAPLKVVEERSIGPSLGKDSVQAGKYAIFLTAILVSMIMIGNYQNFGIMAAFALAFNILFLIGFMALFQATLTMPGIGGIVLTLGMAVDANILIFERIREELKRGMSAIAATNNGYKAAFSTILDANITTIVAAIILYVFGSGPVKGFAVTLIIGIVCSMFTSIYLCKMLVDIFWVDKSSIDNFSIERPFYDKYAPYRNQL